MAITTTCSGCGKTLAVADEFAGRQARCPECGTIYTVPDPSSTLAPLTPQSSPGNLADTTGYAPSDAPLDLGSPTYPTSSPTAGPMPGPSSGHPNSYDMPGDKYWMMAPNGAQYGPADSATLARWFSEGRVGQNYRIRQGENGPWQPAATFNPSATAPPVNDSSNPYSNSANPYAAQSPYTPNAARKYPKTDQSGLVLAMGILAFACPIFGLIGLIVGAQAISDVRAGQSDPATLTTLQVGYYLSMTAVVLVMLCIGVPFMAGVISAILGN